MRYFKQIFTGLSMLAFGSGAVFAQQQEPERPYDASIALGYVGTSGNTEVTTFNTEFLMTYRDAQWVHNLRLLSLVSTQDSRGRAERYYGRNKSDYRLVDERHYLYAQGTYTDDRFSGFDYQATLSAGYGRDFIDNDRFFFEGYAGLGLRMDKERVTGDSEREAVLSAGQNFNWRISDNARFTQALLAEVGDSRTITTFEIGLESNIVDRLATRIAFEARHTSVVPPGTRKTDTQTRINLVYTF